MKRLHPLLIVIFILSCKMSLGQHLDVTNNDWHLKLNNPSTGGNDWYIGASADDWNAGGNKFVISPNSNSDNSIFVIRNNGNVGVGTAFPQDRLHVNGRLRLGSIEYFEDGGTNEIAARGDIRPTSNNMYDLGTSTFRWDDVYATNGTINTSDSREKKNIKSAEYGLEQVLSLRPVSFSWKTDKSQKTKLGLLAQEVAKLIPEVVVRTKSVVDEKTEEVIEVPVDVLGIYYADLIPVLIKAIQEQQQIIERQQKKLDEQDKKYSGQNKEIQALKEELGLIKDLLSNRANPISEQ